MLRTLAVFNQKGGVGKTTIAKTIAQFAAREDLGNLRVLVIDLDPQASISKLSIPMRHDPKLKTIPPIHPDYDPEDPECEGWDGISSSSNIFFPNAEVVPYPVTLPEPIPNMEILPAYKRSMKRVEEQSQERIVERVHDILREFLNQDAVQEAYDLVIIDIGPKESPLYIAALRAATHVVIPTNPDRQSTDGLIEMLDLWGEESARREPSRPLEMLGIVINKFEARYSLHHSTMNAMMATPRVAAQICPVVIPQRAAIAERDAATAKPITVFDLPRKNDVRILMFQLCSHLFQSMFPEHKQRWEQLAAENLPAEELA